MTTWRVCDVLEKKPRAMAGSTPVQQWRAAGRWPECMDAIWRKLETRHGKGGGVGYAPLADVGAEFLFQVISDRAERAALIVTTNLPFSEWTTVFPNPRLCKALLDRITDRAHILETGTESFRFRRTVEGRRKH